jgi:nucleoside-diphosphate-sugar epimerase
MALTNWPARHGDHFRGSRVLVTGGAGFIGSHLVEALLSLGAEVIALDDLSGGERANIEAAAEAAGAEPHFIEGSIGDPQTLREAMVGCRYVFHQAALGSVPASVAEPARFHAVNDTGTFNVLEAARQAGVERVLLAASAAAYGDDETIPKTEAMPTLPQSPYAATKVAGEAWLRAYAASYELDTVALRYFNIFGPRQNANSAYAAVIAAFANALLAGEQSRDFAYVDNVVEANLLAAHSEQLLAGAILNVGCGRRVTVNELLEQMRDALGMNVQPQHDPPRPGDVRHSLADLTRIRHALGYEPVVHLRDGLDQTLAWYRQQLLTA